MSEMNVASPPHHLCFQFSPSPKCMSTRFKLGTEMHTFSLEVFHFKYLSIYAESNLLNFVTHFFYSSAAFINEAPGLRLKLGTGQCKIVLTNTQLSKAEKTNKKNTFMLP